MSWESAKEKFKSIFFFKELGIASKYLTKRFKLTLLLIFNFFLEINSQNLQSTQSRSLLGSGLCLSNPAIIDEHPCAINFLKTPQIFFNQSLDFSLSELSSNHLSFVLPKKNQHYGIAIYNRKFLQSSYTRLALNFSTKINEKIIFGSKINWIAERNIDNINSNSFAPEIGIIYLRNNKTTWGYHFLNWFGKYQIADLKSQLRIGYSHLISQELQVNSALYYNANLPLSLRAGIQYRTFKTLSMRLGISTTTPFYAFGIQLIQQKFIIQFNSSFHNNLGMSPSCSVQYAF